jgi:hypothetical protein
MLEKRSGNSHVMRLSSWPARTETARDVTSPLSSLHSTDARSFSHMDATPVGFGGSGDDRMYVLYVRVRVSLLNRIDHVRSSV